MAVAPALPSPDVLVRRALALAWLTIAWNVVEGVAAIGFGWAEESIALLGFGVDSWVEVASAVVVLWRLRAEGGLGSAMARSRERLATRVIGGLLVALSIGVAAGGAIQLASGQHPETTLPGLVISLLSLGLMAFLWRAKRTVATALDSRTLAADAACSRSCLQLSVVLLAGSLLFMISPALWWADGVAALGLALLIQREGRETMRAASREDFTGGCGCNHCD